MERMPDPVALPTTGTLYPQWQSLQMCSLLVLVWPLSLVPGTHSLLRRTEGFSKKLRVQARQHMSAWAWKLLFHPASLVVQQRPAWFNHRVLRPWKVGVMKREPSWGGLGPRLRLCPQADYCEVLLLSWLRDQQGRSHSLESTYGCRAPCLWRAHIWMFVEASFLWRPRSQASPYPLCVPQQSLSPRWTWSPPQSPRQSPHQSPSLGAP